METSAQVQAVLNPRFLYLMLLGGPKSHELDHYLVSSKVEEAKDRAERAASKGADFVLTGMCFSRVGFQVSCSPSCPGMMVAHIC